MCDAASCWAIARPNRASSRSAISIKCWKTEPYGDAKRLFVTVDNGSSHRGKRSIERARRRDKRITLLHTPVHASWLSQVEIYFSIIQRKVLTPNDFENWTRCECGFVGMKS
jgi:hypothetical protein